MQSKLKDKDKYLKFRLKSIFLDICSYAFLLCFSCCCILTYYYNPDLKNIPYLTTAFIAIITPPLYYLIQKIELFFMQKKFFKDEFVVYELKLLPIRILYNIILFFAGYAIGIAFPQVAKEYFSKIDFLFYIICLSATLYIIYFYHLRTKVIITNYGLRTNYKYDTFFKNIEKISEEKLQGNYNLKVLKIYKKNIDRVETYKKSLIYKLSYQKIENITTSIMQNYEETKQYLFDTYQDYLEKHKRGD